MTSPRADRRERWPVWRNEKEGNGEEVRGLVGDVGSGKRGW